ncbi:MAG: hypothetical protein COX20_00260 [Desulfobacterales bacterium CG23_combo_of_CG06-09_8_20_14_all_52_9]|nr:MAG: hypothetical protein COX20_00260 [Desulfobacterales bacterium CG23_combo_of_CG06-09_8_20_14_all_52_9]
MSRARAFISVIKGSLSDSRDLAGIQDVIGVQGRLDFCSHNSRHRPGGLVHLVKSRHHRPLMRRLWNQFQGDLIKAEWLLPAAIWGDNLSKESSNHKLFLPSLLI